MKAITITAKGQVALNEVPTPEKAAPGTVIIKMKAMGINAGDKFLIAGNYPPGFFTESQYQVAGACGVGEVVALGEGVPEKYRGRLVTVYRSLTKSNDVIGTWSEYAQLPYLQCAILPRGVMPEDYAGSLVNIITAYGAWKQAVSEGHKGILITAGNSDTGKAMLGIAHHVGFPVLSIVRNQKGREELEQLGATNVLAQDEDNFSERLAALSAQLHTTAVFDGVGGTLLGDVIQAAPPASTVYAYGFLGGPTPVSFHTGILMKGITIKGFSNFHTPTVQDPQQLAAALDDINNMIHQPHFTFKAGKTFSLEHVDEALGFEAHNGGKAVLTTEAV